jgi:hypothetical protein
LSQKKNKSPKQNKQLRKTKSRRKPRAVALGISQTKIRMEPRDRTTAVVSEHKTPEVARTDTSHPSVFPQQESRSPSEIVLNWSPWYAIMRQQAWAAYAFANMMRTQQQFTRMLSLS